MYAYIVEMGFYTRRRFESEIDTNLLIDVIEGFRGLYGKYIVDFRVDSMGNMIRLSYIMGNLGLNAFLDITHRLICDIAYCYEVEVLNGLEVEVKIVRDEINSHEFDRMLRELNIPIEFIGVRTFSLGDSNGIYSRVIDVGIDEVGKECIILHYVTGIDKLRKDDVHNILQDIGGRV